MRNMFLALLSGILLALAWPTTGFPLLLFFAFVPLLLGEYTIRMSSSPHKKWRILGLAYLSFLIWNAYTTYWLYFSTPFGGIFAVTVNSLLMALVFLIYHLVAKRTDFRNASVFLIAIWMCFEYLHLHWEFSWPWLNLGNGFSEAIKWVQWYEYTGTFGGTLWVLLVNLIIFRTVLLYQKYREKGIIFRGILSSSILVITPILISLLIFHNYSPGEKSLEVIALQPNINPYTEKYNVTDRRIGQLLNRLAEEAITEDTRLVLAPETVFAYGTDYNRFGESEAAYFTRQFVLKHPKVNFLSGVAMLDKFHDPSMVTSQSNQYGPNTWYNDYNSAFMVNASDSIGMYHKSKLVVGVENFPYQGYLKPILGDVMIDLGGTVAMKTTQKERSVFKLNEGPEVAPIICYESVYGDYVTDYVKNGADFLAIITNDAWWGDTQGHKQHLSYAKLRAVENRRAIARSANTGISAFIDERGEITASLGYEEQGALRGKVSLNDKRTFYSKYGDYLARTAQFLALFIFLFAMVRHKRKR